MTKNMLYSPKIEQAIRTVCLLHRGQLRKGDGTTPFVSHPFVLAFILAQYTDDEDTIVAGVLHDTVEDTQYSFAQMEKEFGVEVKELVASLTEGKKNETQKLLWLTRKQHYLELMMKMNRKALLISAVDKFHNLNSMMYDYKTLGEDMWKRFNSPADKRLWFYTEALKILKERLDHEIVTKFEKTLEQAKVELCMD